MNLSINIDVNRVLKGGVLDKETTAVIQGFCKVLEALDTIPGKKNVYTRDVLADAAVELHLRGKTELSDLVVAAIDQQKMTLYAAMSMFTAVQIMADGAMKGKSLAETLATLGTLQNR